MRPGRLTGVGQRNTVKAQQRRAAKKKSPSHPPSLTHITGGFEPKVPKPPVLDRPPKAPVPAHDAPPSTPHHWGTTKNFTPRHSRATAPVTVSDTPHAQQIIAARSQASIVPLGALARLGVNFSQGALHAGVGFPGGVKDLVTHPIGTAENVYHSYGYKYAPALHGDPRTTLHRMGQDSFGTALDLFSLASMGAGAASKTGLLNVPTERTLAFEGGAVQPLASPNVLTRMFEHRRDRRAELHPNRPFTGAASRVSRRIPFESQRDLTRVQALSAPFAVARKALYPAEDFAFDMFRRYGDKASERLTQEINFRQDRLTQEVGMAERAAQRKRIVQLRLAKKHVENPRKNLLVALTEGRALAGVTQEAKIELGQLTPETAASHLNLSSRLIHGAQWAPTTIEERLAKAHPSFLPQTVEALIGKRVRAHDRKNIGQIVAVDEPTSTATVHFYNRQSKSQQTVLLPLSQLNLVDERGGAIAGAQDAIAGAGAFHAPDVARQPIRSIQQRARGLGKQRPLVHQSTGTLFSQGRIRATSKTTLEDFLNTARYKHHLVDLQKAHSFSIPLDPALGGKAAPGFRHFNPEGFKLPRQAREELASAELESLTPQEFAQAGHHDYQALLDNTFPTEADIAKLPLAMQAKVRQLDERIHGAFTSGGSHLHTPTGELGKLLNSALRNVSSGLRAGFLFAKGSYIPLNFAGSSTAAILRQGVWYLPNLLKAVRVLGDLSPVTLRRIDSEMGTTVTGAVSGPTQGLIAKVTQPLAHFSQNAADLGPRRTAFIHEAAKEGFKTDAQITRLLDDPALRSKLNQLGETAQNSVFKFSKLGAEEQRWLGSWIFVYPWIKSATRYGFRLPLDRPVVANFAANLGKEGHDSSLKILGEIGKLAGLIPMGKVEHKLGVDVIHVRNPNSVTPFGVGAQVLEQMQQFDPRSPVKQGSRAINFANPLLKAGVEAATGLNTYTGRAYPGSPSGPQIFFRDTFGALPAVRSVKGLMGKEQTTPFTESPGKQPTYLPEGPGGAIRGFFLGSLRDRQLNLTAAQAKAESERIAALPAPARVDARAKQTLHKNTLALAQDVRYLRSQGISNEEIQASKREVIKDITWSTHLHAELDKARLDSKGHTKPISAREALKILLPYALAKADPSLHEDIVFAAQEGSGSEYQARGAFGRIYRAVTPYMTQWNTMVPSKIEQDYIKSIEAHG